MAERRERHRIWKQKYRERKRKDRIPNSERPFIFWDGEGPRDAGYALFGSSAGDEICHPFLSTTECLDLLLSSARTNPDAIHISFGFNYDASMILADLPWRCLQALRKFGATYWHDYEIEHIPHKWFKVRKGGVSVQVFDIRSFFAGSYVSALLDMGIGGADVEAIAADKKRRSVFAWADIDSIRRYWLLELKYGPILAERLRAAFLGAGYDLRSWHGPGALARMAIRRHNVYDAMAESPLAVKIAARYAFAGGRFEMFRGGYIQERIYNADLRSAYPAYARCLPNLARGSWRRGTNYEHNKFGVYHIRYASQDTDPLAIHPLFYRNDAGIVSWPQRCEGWYWGPEAELVADNPDATFLEAWIFDEDDNADRPFRWIEEYYERRAILKKLGNPLQLTFKLIINSVYGQLAQRTGWDKKNKLPPKTHQLEWAGYITSACRAAVYRAAKTVGSKLVSIDTDGIYALAPIGVVPGPRLGEWELEEYDEGIFWQSGIYALKQDGEWKKGKTRGIPKGSYTPEQLRDCIRDGRPLQIPVKSFIGYGLALNGQFEALNTWRTEVREIVFGGQGKRYHNELHYCPKRCKGGIHHFIPLPSFNRDIHSKPHYLPWLKNDPYYELRKNLHADYVAYDNNDADEW